MNWGTVPLVRTCHQQPIVPTSSRPSRRRSAPRNPSASGPGGVDSTGWVVLARRAIRCGPGPTRFPAGFVVRTDPPQ